MTWVQIQPGKLNRTMGNRVMSNRAMRGKRPRQRRQWLRVRWPFAIAFGLLLIGSWIPVRLAIAQYQYPHPTAIFVLGGDPARMELAAKLGHAYPALPIWVSDYVGELPHDQRIFQDLGTPLAQLHQDGQATDTVTNFTTLVNMFAQQQLWHLCLVTSDYHMRRSLAIATLVFGSRGITVSPVPVPSAGLRVESGLHVARDCLRCLVWLVTGKTGASLNPRI